MAEYGFKQIEDKYGVKVVKEDPHWNPCRQRFIVTYKIYSADGCVWEKGLSRAAVKLEVMMWEKELLTIKAKTEKR